MKAIRKEQQATMKPLREQLRIQLDELRLLVDKKAGDAQLTAKLDELKKTRKTLDDNREKFMERMAAILTPEQKARLVLRMEGAWKKAMKGGGREGWRGHGDGDDGDDEHEGGDHHGDGHDKPEGEHRPM